MKTNPIWCETVLLIKSKIKAIGETTVDCERTFHQISRHQTKLANRLDKNLGTRLKVSMHIPKDPAKINWEMAFETFESVINRCKINLPKPGKNFEERKKLKGLQMDLRYLF